LRRAASICPDLRRVVVWLEDKKEKLVLLTNNFELAAVTIAEIL
jgi:hypothetical protein